jgi:MinD-like ATPase involved in chromosome partitioning or flagellar assembly
MKIRLGILDEDKNYLNRMVSICTNKFADRLEVYSFTDDSVAMDAIKTTNLDVFIANEAFEIDVKKLPAKCGFAYLVDATDIETFKGEHAIFKYQKIEMIYKNLLEIFSDNLPDSIGIKFDGDSSSKLVTFVSANGGAGSSTAAAAFAKNFAAKNKKVLYLNLEQFGSADTFFSGEGNSDFGDIIYALKSKKANISLKLESAVKRDASGVYFYSAPKSSMQITELHPDEIKRLITDLMLIGAYDLVVIDPDFQISELIIELFKKSSLVVFVSDGTEISNTKLVLALDAFEIMEQHMDIPLVGRFALLYNKFSNKDSRTIDGINIRTIGGAPRYEHATPQSVVSRLLQLSVFDKI